MPRYPGRRGAGHHRDRQAVGLVQRLHLAQHPAVIESQLHHVLAKHRQRAADHRACHLADIDPGVLVQHALRGGRAEQRGRVRLGADARHQLLQLIGIDAIPARLWRRAEERAAAKQETAPKQTENPRMSERGIGEERRGGTGQPGSLLLSGPGRARSPPLFNERGRHAMSGACHAYRRKSIRTSSNHPRTRRQWPPSDPSSPRAGAMSAPDFALYAPQPPSAPRARPYLYKPPPFGVPDTLDGRFDLVGLHVIPADRPPARTPRRTRAGSSRRRCSMPCSATWT